MINKKINDEKRLGISVNLLFWNMKNNSNETWVEHLIRERNVDIALFAEYKSTSFNTVVSNLPGYIQYDGYGGCQKITLLCKKPLAVKVKREQNRYTLYSCTCEQVLYNIIGIHLPASPSSNPNDRKNVIRDIIHDIEEQEKEEKHKNTIVIGDFNCNPFDEEIIQKDSFNAVLFKELIKKQEVVIYNEKRWRRFYNPILTFLSEDTKTYGSLYYSSGIAPLYWNSFDQVLVRKELIDRVSSLEYIKQINGKSLLKDVKPNDSISDHLPLIVEITKGV